MPTRDRLDGARSPNRTLGALSGADRARSAEGHPIINRQLSAHGSTLLSGKAQLVRALGDGCRPDDHLARGLHLRFEYGRRGKMSRLGSCVLSRARPIRGGLCPDAGA